MTNVNGTELAKISYGMSQMARTHPNDTISNALARVSEKVSAFAAYKAGEPWGVKSLTEEEKAVVKYYLSNRVA